MDVSISIGDLLCSSGILTSHLDEKLNGIRIGIFNKDVNLPDNKDMSDELEKPANYLIVNGADPVHIETFEGLCDRDTALSWIKNY
ncbi:hypothetical protein PQ743_02380 [Thermoanaerobacterium thermosaccharolyticum]|uniref:hypothetical protein n=1 Tax=Thermoanaerobacterium thermosaccharolyticum TaxID=1517 RepID=UPI003DA93665